MTGGKRIAPALSLVLMATLVAGPGIGAPETTERLERFVNLMTAPPASPSPGASKDRLLQSKSACQGSQFADRFAAVLFDDTLPGDGYYVVDDGANLSVAFFGYDSAGKLLWMVGTVPASDSSAGIQVSIPLVEVGSRGRFSVPQNPGADAIPSWGTLMLELDCAGGVPVGTATLAGNDGSKTQSLSALVAGGGGAGSGPGLIADRLSAVVFDGGAPGDGFYLVSDDNSVSLAFFGYRADGAPLWMVSTVPVAQADLTLGGKTRFPMSIGGPQGAFLAPQNPLAAPLPIWGEVELALDCNADGGLVGTATLEGLDGDKPMRLSALLDLGSCPMDLEASPITIMAAASVTRPYSPVPLDVATDLPLEALTLEIDTSGEGSFRDEAVISGELTIEDGQPILVPPMLSYFQEASTYRYDVRVRGPAGSVSNRLTLSQQAKGAGNLPAGTSPAALEMMMQLIAANLGDPILTGAAGQVQPGATEELLSGLGQDTGDYNEDAAALLEGAFEFDTDDYPPGRRKGMTGARQAVIEIFDCLVPALQRPGSTPTTAANECANVAGAAVRNHVIPSIEETHGRVATATSRLSSLLGSRAGRALEGYGAQIAFSAQTSSFTNTFAQVALRLPAVDADDQALDFVGGRLTRFGRGRLYETLSRDLTAFDREVLAILSDPGVANAVSGLSPNQVAALRGLENSLLNTQALGDQLDQSPESYGGTGESSVGTTGLPIPGEGDIVFEGTPEEYCAANPELAVDAAELGFSSCEAFIRPFFDPIFLQSTLLPLFETLETLFLELETSGCLLGSGAGSCEAFFEEATALLDRIIAVLMAYDTGGCDAGYATFERGNSLACVWSELVLSTGTTSCPAGSRVPSFDLGGPACIAYSRDYLRNGQCAANYQRVFFAPLGAETCRWATLPLSLPAAYAVDRATRSRRTLER